MRRLSLLAVLGVMALVPATASAATTYNVNTTEDQSGAGFECGAGEECSLRGALNVADDNSEEATINLPAGKYVSGQDEWVVDDDAQVTIKGAGAGAGGTELVGDGVSGDFLVEEDSGLTLQDVAVTGGSDRDGGGVYVEFEASLDVVNSAIENNESVEFGGGIYGEEESSVTVRESSVTKNRSHDGGGIAMATEEICEEPTAAVRHDGSAKPAQLDELTHGLTVSRSTIEGNTADEGVGGGIYNGPVPTGCDFAKQASVAGPDSLEELAEEEGGLTIEQSTIARNQATVEEIQAKPAIAGYEREGIGGGIYEESELVEDPIVNSTITGNTAAITGGGIADGLGPALLVNDTIADNSAEGVDIGARGASSAWGGRANAKPAIEEEGIGENLAVNFEAFIELRNTIVAETSGEGENCEGDVESYFDGPGHNLDFPSETPEPGETDSCGLSAEHDDLVNVNPQLSPEGLHANGGPTETISIPGSSPAIGQVPVAGDCAEGEGLGPESVDQRSAPRPGIPGDGCDIGAYEYQQPQSKPAPTPENKPTANPPAAAVLGVKIASPVCASKRDFTIHIQNVKQFGVVSAVIAIDGKHKRTITGKHLRTGIDLKGLPKGTFTVSIVAHTKSGLTLHGKRTYHTCHTRLPGHVYLRL
jgi:hypothetical protein